MASRGWGEGVSRKGGNGVKAGSQYDAGTSVTTLAPASYCERGDAGTLERSKSDARIELISIPASKRSVGPASDQSECRIVVNHALPTLQVVKVGLRVDSAYCNPIDAQRYDVL